MVILKSKCHGYYTIQQCRKIKIMRERERERERAILLVFMFDVSAEIEGKREISNSAVV